MTDTVNVPREPTEAMIEAGVRSVMSFGRVSNGVCNAYRAMIVAAPKAEPEAPKGEQEPVGYLESAAIADLASGFASVTATIYGKPESGCEAIYTHPAPASDELLEALREVTPELTAEFSNIDGPWCRGQLNVEDVWSRLIDAQIEAIVKHKGPQS